MNLVGLILSLTWLILLYRELEGQSLLDSDALFLLTPMPFVSVLEIWNELYDKGAYYPEPQLIQFPFFEFPLAIVLAGGFLVYIIHKTSKKLTNNSNKFYIPAIMIVSLIGIPIEYIFTNLGYWQYTGWETYNLTYFLNNAALLKIYLYTLAYTLPGITIAGLVKNRKKSWTKVQKLFADTLN